jgi:hypothetical protein
MNKGYYVATYINKKNELTQHVLVNYESKTSGYIYDYPEAVKAAIKYLPEADSAIQICKFMGKISVQEGDLWPVNPN